MLKEEGLLEEGTSELAAMVAARQVMASVTSRSLGGSRRRIAVPNMMEVLGSLEQTAMELDNKLQALEGGVASPRAKQPSW